MKRRHWVMLWVLAGVAMYWFNATRGQTLLKRDVAAAALRAGGAAEAAGDFTAAVNRYREVNEILQTTKSDANERLAASIALTRTQNQDKPLPEKVEAWEKLLKTAAADTASQPALLNDVRTTLADLHYDAAYALRRSGAPETQWRDEAELARQQFTRIAQTDASPVRAETAARNVEMVYRLEHTDRNTLMSRALRPNDIQKSSQIAQASETPGEAGDATVLPNSGKSSGGGGQGLPRPKPLPQRKKGS